ncbi:MAG: 1,2-dihydroxy-3-keto-5-methylthiopentene dioxygenase [Bacteriovorax sp.]
MATLLIAKENKTITDFKTIQSFLNDRGVMIANWEAKAPINHEAGQEEILAAYSHELKPFMEKNGYATADVINVHPKTENLISIREKFMKEHTHSEDEIRFFVDGQGKFWFHLDNEEILCVTCERGDFMSVPKNVRHWFDLAPGYFVKAIRIFSNMDGWVPHYTSSGIDASYNP